MTTTEQAVIDAIRRKMEAIKQSAKSSRSQIEDAEQKLNAAIVDMVDTDNRIGEMEHDLSQLEAELAKRQEAV